MKINKFYRFPTEPSIVGFIFLAGILGIFTSGRPDPIGTIIVLLINFHIIFTIDTIYHPEKLLSLPPIYAIVSNAAILFYLGLQEYDILYSIVPTGLLIVLTIVSRNLYGKTDMLTTSTGSLALTSLVLPSAAIAGNITVNTFNIWIIYSLYILTSVLYVESKIERIDTWIPMALSYLLIPIFYLLNQYYIVLLADVLAKTTSHHIQKNYIALKDITKLGVTETKRLFIFTIGALLITFLL